jgi:hypothetical protein
VYSFPKIYETALFYQHRINIFCFCSFTLTTVQIFQRLSTNYLICIHMCSSIIVFPLDFVFS